MHAHESTDEWCEFLQCKNCEEINCFLENILVTDEYSKIQQFFCNSEAET